MKIKAFITLVIISVILCGCAQDKEKEGKRPIDKTQEQKYYESVAIYNVDNREIIEKYTNTLLKYAGLDIPEAEWEFLLSNTDKTYRDELKEWFSNKSEKTIENGEMQKQIGGEYQSEAGEYPSADGVETEYTSANEVIQSIYIFKKDKYIMKVGTPSGYIYLLTVDLENGLVVGIHEV